MDSQQEIAEAEAERERLYRVINLLRGVRETRCCGLLNHSSAGDMVARCAKANVTSDEFKCACIEVFSARGAITITLTANQLVPALSEWLASTGWQNIASFTNPRSGNVIHIFFRSLYS